jgi:hypothetical protein
VYNSYYKYKSPGNSGGKYLHYFKDYTTYQRQSSICLQQESCEYEPSYYFKELYPLARLEALCDRNGNIYNLFGFCWNKAYVPPPPPPEDNVVVTFQIIMAAGEGCPTDMELYNILGQLVYQLGVDYPELAGMQVVVDANTVDCRREVSKSGRSRVQDRSRGADMRTNAFIMRALLAAGMHSCCLMVDDG